MRVAVLATSLILAIFTRADIHVLDFGFPSGPHPECGWSGDPVAFADVLAPLAKTTIVPAEKMKDVLERAGSDDMLVVPCGSAFPADACAELTNFFARGGALLSSGGYAFDRPLRKTDGGWTFDKTLHINKRHGLFRDCLKTEPTQTGAFDPSFLLEDVVRMCLAPSQFGILPNVSIEGPVSGFAAVGVLGENGHGYAPNSCTWRPILETCGSDGKSRGPAGAFIRHYAGVFKGSQWAVFGVTDRDIFAGSAKALLAAVARRLLERFSLAETTTEYACHRVGETVELKTLVVNFGKAARAASVSFTLRNGMGRTLGTLSTNVVATACSVTPVSLRWPVTEDCGDFVEFIAELRAGGRIADREENGFSVWKEETIRKGPVLSIDGTLFAIDGRRTFTVGAQTYWGQIRPYTARSPKEMSADFAMMREYGFRWARLFLPWDSEHQKRISDSAVLLAQKHGIVIYHTQQWMDSAADDAALAKQNARIAEIAARYRDVPGFAIDICNEPRLSGMGPSPEAADKMKRWVDTNFEAAEKARPGVILSVGHSQGWCMESVKSTKDPPVSVLDVPFTDRHYYGPWGDMFQDLKDMDMRAIGKPLILAECGAKCHPTWAKVNMDRIGDTEERYDARFKCYAAHCFGLGCSAMLAWCWRDPMEGCFPCGIMHQTRVPRRAARTLAKMAKAFGEHELAANPPDVVVRMAEIPRMRGGAGRKTCIGRTYAVDRALRYWGANWSKITERALGKVRGVKLVIDPETLDTKDETALRTEIGRRLRAAGCALARMDGDDRDAFYFRIPGNDGSMAWVCWNPQTGKAVFMRRGSATVDVSPLGVGFIRIGRDGTVLRMEKF